MLAIFLAPPLLSAQNSDADSLRAQVKALDEDYPAILALLSEHNDQAEQWSDLDRGWFLQLKARALDEAQRYDEALELYNEAYDVLSALDAPSEWLYEAVQGRSYVMYIKTGDPEVYCPERKLAVEIARALNNNELTAKALVRHSFCFDDPAEFAGGVRSLSEAIELADTKQLNPRDRGMVYNAAGKLYSRNELHGQSYEYIKKAHDSWALVDDKQDMFNMQHTLVAESIALGDFDTGETHVEQLYQLAGSSPEFSDFLFFAHYNKGLLNLHSGNFVIAADALKEALTLADTTNEQSFVARARYMLPIALYRGGMPEDSLSRLQALELDPNSGAFGDYGADVSALNSLATGDEETAIRVLLEARQNAIHERREHVQNAITARDSVLGKQLDDFEQTVLEQQLALTRNELKIKQLEVAAQRDDRNLAILIAAVIGVSFLALITYFVIIVRSRQRLREQARTDALTGIPNRAYGRELAKAALNSCREERSLVSLIVLDIDRFKQVNDTHGHVAGDRGIRLVAQTVDGALQAGQQVSRLGGEEFMVVLPGHDLTAARDFAEALRTKIESHPLILRGTIQTLTASMGVAEAAPDESLDELINRADHAMYAAKQAGRNRVHAQEAA